MQANHYIALLKKEQTNPLSFSIIIFITIVTDKSIEQINRHQIILVTNITTSLTIIAILIQQKTPDKNNASLIQQLIFKCQFKYTNSTGSTKSVVIFHLFLPTL